MNQLRERWEGVALPGGYVLHQWLSGDEAAGYFETAPDSDGCRLEVKLMPETAGQLDLWQRTRLLRHPNLRGLLDCGRAELGGGVAVYAVFEYADDTLAAALLDSPLTEPEAREVLDAAVAALRYLQSQGLAHGPLDPEHVLAVGESIKLSTDALREAAADAPFTDELRAFWYQISPSTLARSADILAQALGGGAPPAPPAAPAPAPPQVARAAAEAPSKPFPKWILVGAAALVLLILGLNLRRSPETPPQPGPLSLMPAPKAASPVVTSPVKKPSPVSETASGKAPEPKAPGPKAPEPKAAAPKPAGQGLWRVIAFTTRSREDAAKKAGQVNQSHPDFTATVYTAPEKKGLYLVALGGRMSREDALRVQKKARAERVSRDVYVKKFLE